MASTIVNLSNLLPELVQRVAFFIATDNLITAPNIVSLMCTCRALYANLAFDAAPYLYDRIFRAKFDTTAPRRRLGEDVMTSVNLANELRRRYSAMRRMADNAFYGLFVRDDLWLAYLMLLESDGRNEAQLIHRARIQRFALDFVHTHYMSGTKDGWPIETDELALACWIAWMTYDPGMFLSLS